MNMDDRSSSDDGGEADSVYYDVLSHYGIEVGVRQSQASIDKVATLPTLCYQLSQPRGMLQADVQHGE